MELESVCFLCNVAIFVYNNTIHIATEFQSHELVYSNPVKVPYILSRIHQPCYNYEDYTNELQNKLQESIRLSRDRLIDKKHKTKAKYL